jgi:hypothetical protein
LIAFYKMIVMYRYMVISYLVCLRYINIILLFPLSINTDTSLRN